MKLGTHGRFLIDFVAAYVHDEMDRFDFDMDYSGHIIAHFPGFEAETPRLAAKFSRTIERAYSAYGWMTDDAFALAISDALDEFLGATRMTDIY